MPIRHATRDKRSIQIIDCPTFEIKSIYFIGNVSFELNSI